MITDRIKWNARHENRIGFHPTDSYLKKQLTKLKADRVLDLACGRGRNAFFLAEQGYKVTGADISDIGLHMLRSEAKQRDLDIKTVNIDLDHPEILLDTAPYDSIICINFKPGNNLLGLVSALLEPEGIFLWCSFNEKQAEVSGFPINMALHPEEYINYFPALQLLEYVRFTDDSGFRDGYLFKKTIA
ncbi:MAG: hypothetical protein CVT92_01170 [Bacteroidetes bacterium HGW-Bacteroidetes-1]|jgi:2-polyprenyl-3-methyl-5-hydroxy-6-metoxy-1,4-benzoquinol methylase|nr:MAG: hypothetical protein CVT92_01170 [Bacteroidetes bacterium HGW-Bacteroidetes-1]